MFRKSLRALAVLIFVPALAAPFGSARADGFCPGAAGTVSFADSPWPPFTLGEEGGTIAGGRTLTLLRRIFDPLGTSIEVRLYPWKRTLKLAETGRVDGIPILMRAPERERYLIYTDRLTTVHDVFYFNRHNLGSFAWRTYEDLRPYTIGLVKGYSYADDVLEAIERQNLNVEYSRSTEGNYTRLLAGRVDLVLDEEIGGDAIIASHPQWQRAFAKASKPTASYDYFMAFSRKSPFAACVPRINAWIRAHAATGQLDQILKEPAEETSP